MMKLAIAIALTALLGVAACEKIDPAIGAATRIDYDRITAAEGDPAAMRALLTNSTHNVPMLGGSEYRYLGKGDFAAIKGPRDALAVAGYWRIIPTKRGGFEICIGRGPIPADPSSAKVPCMMASEFVGHIFVPVEGDPLGLAAQARGERP